jgi:hypothetical protein
MKKKQEIIIIFILLFFINNVYSQINDSCSVEIPGTTYFEYFRYPIRINIKDTSGIFIESDGNSSIFKYYDGSYKIAFYGGQGRSTLKVYKREENKKHLICSKDIQYEKLHVTPFISGEIYNEYLVSTDKLKNSKIRACILNYGFEAFFEVKSFIMTFVINNEVVDIKTEGCAFTEEQLKYLEELPNHCPVVIRNIVIERTKDNFERIEPLVFFIKKDE